MPSDSVQYINPPTLSKPTGYTHAVEVSGGKTVYISGQIALDVVGNVVGEGDLRVQTYQVFENLRAALHAVGATFDHVVKVTYFVVDISQMPVVRAVRNEYFNPARLPASTAVEVRRLVRDDLLLEVEAIAVLPE